MLKHLNIRNYALIKNLQLNPSKGLNIVTGETGAGKSIILGAIGLLLGKRADTKALLNKESKCVIEGIFDIANYQLKDIFDQEDLDYDDETIFRREIGVNGKSRAFINDLPVRLDTLSLIGSYLLDIHSQHDTLNIGGKATQLKFIDEYARNMHLSKAYANAFTEYTSIQRSLNELQLKRSRDQKEADYNQYLLDELLSADISEEEQEELESEMGLLDNAEDIKLKLTQVNNEFNESEFSINDRLAELGGSLDSLSSVSEELRKLAERFNGGLEELKDVVHDLQKIEESVEYNPERLEEVKERLSEIYRLQQKHQVNSTAELLKIQSDLENKMDQMVNTDERISLLESQLSNAQKQMTSKAEKLSESRRNVLDQFSDHLNNQLKMVGLPDAHVEVACKRIEPMATGIDEISLLFSANKGVPAQPVMDVASGGEFSRLMFCVKYLLADKTALPTIIFDEIDTGVSGEIAKKLASMMHSMASNHQVISISHQPQIAAKGESHYFVYKDNSSEMTQSLVKKLNEEERLTEIAKMIGGDNPSEAAINNARELMEVNYAQ